MVNDSRALRTDQLVACQQLLENSTARAVQADYILGCHYHRASDRLLVAAGSQAGSAAVFPLIPSGTHVVPGAADMILAGGHCDTVRPPASPTCKLLLLASR